MQYNIEILSKQECIIFSTRELNKDYIIISINDTNCDTVIFKNSHIKDVLKITFDDLTFPIAGHTLIDDQISLNIKNFIDSYKDSIKNIIVHCTAGISRSGAVGCTIARYLNGDDSYLLQTGLYMPNKLVYKTMCNTLGLEFSEELFDEKLQLRLKNKLNNNQYDEMFFDIELT